MHPGFYAWFRGRRAHGCGAHVESYGECGSGHGEHGHHRGRGFGHEHGGPFAHAAPGFDHDASSAFGVRRPLRFLAHKLELNEDQVALLAAILDELKTERAQAAVNQRRRISALAEAIEGGQLDEGKLKSAGDEQVHSSESLRTAVEGALRKLHAALDDTQRKKLAYMLRTGLLSI